MFFAQVVLYFALFILFVMVVSAVIGVPFLPAHRKQAQKMMELADIRPGMRVVDLGSGAGRLLFLAAARGAIATGYELNPFLCLWTNVMIKIKGLSGKVKVHCRSMYDADLSNIDVAFTFLFPKPMIKLAPKLFAELRPGSTVVSYAFSVPGHTPIKKEQGIYVYKV